MSHPDQAWTDRLTEAAAEGGRLDLTDVADAFPADALREFIFRNAPDRDYPAGLTLVGLRIQGPLDLSYLPIPKPLRIVNSYVEGRVTLAGSTLGTVDFTGTSVQGLILHGAKVTGDVLLSDGFKSAGEVSFQGMRVEGNLVLKDAIIHNSGGVALSLDGAEITGSVRAENLQTVGTFRGIGVRVGGQMILQGAHLVDAGGTALSLDGADIGAGLFATEGFTAVGKVRALSAHIGNWASFADARVIHDGDDGVALDRSTITGVLDFSGATFTNPGGDSLSIENARIIGNMFITNGFRADGQVRAGAIKIEGALSIEDAVLNNPGGDALSLPGAEIARGMFVRQITATGQINAPALMVGGQLDLDGASLVNPDGATLVLHGAKIVGDFNFRRCSSVGDIRAIGLTVTGQLVLGSLVSCDSV